MSKDQIRVSVTYVHEGQFHNDIVVLPAAGRSKHASLADFVNDDPAVQREFFVNFDYVCSLQVVPD